MNPRISFLLSGFVALATACDSATAEPAELDVAREAAVDPSEQSGPSASDQGEVEFSIGADWEASVEAATNQLREGDAQLADTLYDLQPRTTRAQTLRLTGPLVRQPIAAAVFLDRLANGDESPQVRAALVEALPRTTGPFGVALVDLMAAESDPGVRLEMVGALRTADSASALIGLQRGLADTDARVRVAAAKTASRRTDGVELAQALVAAASDDPNDEVKLEAMRTLGALKVESAESLLVAELGSSDAEHRLTAVRALTRIDPQRAKQITALRALSSDADPRVAGAVQKTLAASND